MASIILSKDYRIETTPEAWVLQKRKSARWKSITWHSTLASALKTYYERACRDIKGEYDLPKYLNEINLLYARLDTLLHTNLERDLK